jgi:phosphoribosylglycinamide formyltransferase-1
VSPLSIVVLCSGRGSNLQALIDAQQSGALPLDIRAVVSDKSQCHALERAQRAGIPTHVLQPRDYADRISFDEALFATVARCDPQLVVFAGYMRIVDPAAMRTWLGRMINIHPSLLPKYPGLRTHQRALDAGDSEHGASVHFVTAELDGGPVIAQAMLQVADADNAATLAARLLPIEHRLLVAAVGLIATGRIRLGVAGVELDERVIAAPLQLAATGTLQTVAAR